MKKEKVKKIKNKKKKKGLLFRFVRSIIKTFYGKVRHLGVENIPSEPSIIVGNHAQMNGPITAEIYAPFKRKTWCIGNMLHLRDFPKYMLEDICRYKPKWTRIFYLPFCYLIAPLAVYLFKTADTIGVYKDMRIISTLKKSVTALKEGEHLIIFPECHTKFNNIVYEFQDKFIDTAKLYFKDTGKELSFVPMYVAPKLKTIVYGKPIKFDSTSPIEEQRKIICDYLKTEITHLAQSLPVHTVVPYANIKKKNYPKSK